MVLLALEDEDHVLGAAARDEDRPGVDPEAREGGVPLSLDGGEEEGEPRDDEEAPREGLEADELLAGALRLPGASAADEDEDVAHEPDREESGARVSDVLPELDVRVAVEPGEPGAEGGHGDEETENRFEHRLLPTGARLRWILAVSTRIKEYPFMPCFLPGLERQIVLGSWKYPSRLEMGVGGPSITRGRRLDFR